jgi:hypothetical protein
VIVFLLPLAICQETKLSGQELFEVFATLGLGMVVIIVATCRFVISYVVTVVPVFYWCKSYLLLSDDLTSIDTLGTAEHCTAIIIVCLPVFKPLIRNMRRERIGSIRIHTSALGVTRKISRGNECGAGSVDLTGAETKSVHITARKEPAQSL